MLLEEIASIKQSNEYNSSTLDQLENTLNVSQVNVEESKIIKDITLVNGDQNKDDSETIICFKNVSTTWNEVRYLLFKLTILNIVNHIQLLNIIHT